MRNIIISLGISLKLWFSLGLVLLTTVLGYSQGITVPKYISNDPPLIIDNYVTYTIEQSDMLLLDIHTLKIKNSLERDLRLGAESKYGSMIHNYSLMAESLDNIDTKVAIAMSLYEETNNNLKTLKDKVSCKSCNRQRNILIAIVVVETIILMLK